jgi:hypothetical protein
MRAFAVGAGQTADFGRSPRAVPLGSLDIFAGPVTPTRPRHLGVIKQGTAKGNNAGTQNAQNGASRRAERRRKRLGTSNAARNEPF